MLLKQIILKNFQKHSDLKLDFTSGVNVVYGATDAGKSCIRRAISWVFFNTPQGDVVRKEGTKKTSVKVILDNNVAVERIKSASINAYILIVGDEKKRFDSVGRKIPEEVAEALKTSLIDINGDTINLNIADQIALPFLMDKSATFRSKLFNKLTGSEITDKVLQDLNKDILRLGREEKIIKEELDQKEQQEIGLKVDTDNLKNKCIKLKKAYENLKEKKEKYIRLSDLVIELGKNNKDIGVIENLLKNRKTIVSTDKLREKEEKLNNLIYLENSLKKNNTLIDKMKQKLLTVKDFSKLSINKLKIIWEKANMLQETKSELEQTNVKIKNIKLKKEQAKETLAKWISRYKEELKRRKICPTCKQTITEKTIENLNLK